MKYLCCLFVVLCGCSLWIKTEPVEKPALALKNPDPLKLTSVNLIVVTRENVESKFKELEKKGLKPVIIGMSGTDYKILALNISQIKQYINMLQEILKQYRDYYEPVKP